MYGCASCERRVIVDDGFGILVGQWRQGMLAFERVSQQLLDVSVHSCLELVFFLLEPSCTSLGVRSGELFLLREETFVCGDEPVELEASD